MNDRYDVVIIGSGPAGLGAAYHIAENSDRSLLVLDKSRFSSGGLRNDCKQNYTYPVGFNTDLWHEEESGQLLDIVAEHLKPEFIQRRNLDIYIKRAEKLGVKLLNIKQAHVGTDHSINLISNLISGLQESGVTVLLETEVAGLNNNSKTISIKNGQAIEYGDLVIATGRAGYSWLLDIILQLGIEYTDNIVDVGVRIETREEHYPVVRDYYDPKFIFPSSVRTFCTNSGSAYIVKERYDKYYSVNGHSYSSDKEPNGLVNFALLKTIILTDPVVSGHQFAEILGQMAMQLSGGQPMMQRVGDFRLGKRSKRETFNDDLYNFEPTLKTSTPGDVALAIPSRILRDIWCSMKFLDTIVPGLLHPSTIIYYPEIKTYAIRPDFINRNFLVRDNIYMIGDGAGTSRGITAAWASGIRAAQGILAG